MTPADLADLLTARVDDERMLSSDEAGVTYDHAGSEALVCILPAAWELIPEDPEAALVILRALETALDETPLGAPAGTLHKRMVVAVHAMTGGRCGRHAREGALRVIEGGA
jgi:hypothetical protein